MSNNIDQIYEKFGSNICLFPFTAGFYSLEVQTKPIIMPCSSTKVIDWEVQDSSILKTMNNNQWKTLRKTFINGSCHDTDICKTCSLAEQNNGDSPRKLNNQYFVEHLNANIIAQVENIISNDYEISQILSMDYCPSNYCNYECIMCFSGASSKRKTFELKIAGLKPDKKITHSVDQDFYDLLNRVEILNLTGGETLLQKQVHEVIDYLITQDLAKNITISLLTNASKYPTNLIDKFKKFKNVFYTLSIDGIGDVIEYQRRGAVWQEVEATAIQLYKEFGCIVNYVLTAVNVFSFIEFVDWLEKNNIDKVSISLVYARNRNISITVIPTNIKNELIHKLSMAKHKYTNAYYRDLIDQMLEILVNTQHDSTLISQFKNAISIEDSVSKKPLRDIVPELRCILND